MSTIPRRGPSCGAPHRAARILKARAAGRGQGSPGQRAADHADLLGVAGVFPIRPGDERGPADGPAIGVVKLRLEFERFRVAVQRQPSVFRSASILASSAPSQEPNAGSAAMARASAVGLSAPAGAAKPAARTAASIAAAVFRISAMVRPGMGAVTGPPKRARPATPALRPRVAAVKRAGGRRGVWGTYPANRAETRRSAPLRHGDPRQGRLGCDGADP